jgi:diketogulonate reductase-like aldo/keto reductase
MDNRQQKWSIWYSDKATAWMTKELWLYSQQWQQVLLFFDASRMALGSGDFFLMHSPPSSNKNNTWIYTAIPSYVLKAWQLSTEFHQLFKFTTFKSV